jgi:hypothetical protein
MDNGSDRSNDFSNAFTKMWSEFASKMATAGVSFNPQSPPPEAARQIRDAMFDAMSKYCEEFMRSPQFLESMKDSMDASMAFRQQLNTFLTRAHHEMQGVAQEDMEGLYQAMDDLERRIDSRFQSLEGRIVELIEKVDRLKPQAEASSRPASKSKPSAAKPSGRRKGASGGASTVGRKKKTQRKSA